MGCSQKPSEAYWLWGQKVKFQGHKRSNYTVLITRGWLTEGHVPTAHRLDSGWKTEQPILLHATFGRPNDKKVSL